MSNDQAPPLSDATEGPEFRSVDYIAAPAEEVFDHLTRGEQTKRYYFGMPINDPEQVGDAVYFGPDPASSPIRGTVTAFERPRRFGHTFEFSHHDEGPSQVDFELQEEAPELTRLTTIHRGFESTASGTYADIVSGWPAILSSLKTLLETGEPITWPEPEEA